MTAPPPGFLRAVARDGPLTERAPPRRGCEVEPLIDGDAMRRALETAALDAKVTLDLAYWQLDPTLETLSAFAMDPILHGDFATADRSVKRQFGMLIVDALARGVTVRVLLSDFEPLFDPELHIDAWSSYYTLAHLIAEAARRSPAIDPTLFQMICVRHPATIFPGALEPLTGDAATADALEIALGDDLLDNALKHLNDLIADPGLSEALDSFDLSPGLWPVIAFDPAGPGKFKATAAPPFSMGVASHHVKLCVVDDARALLGGFNVNGHAPASRPQHRLDAPDADVTHDVHLEVRGPVAADLKRFFAGLWNQGIVDFASFLDAANLLAPREKLPRTVLTPALAPTRFTGPPPGARMAQVVRTVSGEIPSAASHSRTPPLPEELAFDTRDAYRAAIDAAETYIYIENQYFRWPPLASRLARALRRNPKLHVIMVLPFRPEESGDAATLHGNAIQAETLSGLIKEFGLRFGLYTFVSPTLPADVEYRRARTIYVHSKLLVVDDAFALVGSANFNGRSMLVDTEIGVAWTGGSSVAKFRKQLWKHALGAATDQGAPEEFGLKWQWRAFKNDLLAPADRVGFVVHLDVASLALGLSADSPLNPRPEYKPLAPALDVYSSALGGDLAGRKRPRRATPPKPAVS